MAGLKGLKPMPPNSCLATTMAKTVPETVCHQGSSGGSARASSQAVTTALRSIRVAPTGRWRRRSTAASAATARNDRDPQVDQDTPAEEPQHGQRAGHQREQHQAHDPRHALWAAQVR